ncbi:hypothetical protein ACVCFV_22685 [Klebsiella pneumoniae]
MAKFAILPQNANSLNNIRAAEYYELTGTMPEKRHSEPSGTDLFIHSGADITLF